MEGDVYILIGWLFGARMTVCSSMWSGPDTSARETTLTSRSIFLFFLKVSFL